MGKIPQLQSDQTQVPHACRTLFNMSRDDEPNFGPCLRATATYRSPSQGNTKNSWLRMEASLTARRHSALTIH